MEKMKEKMQQMEKVSVTFVVSYSIFDAHSPIEKGATN